MGYTSKPFQIVRACDDAIEDLTGPDAAKYASTRDVSLLKYKEGQRPVIFWGRRLTVSEEREVESASSNENEQYAAAFARGITRVENLEWPDGARRDWFREDDKRPVRDDVLAEFFDRATRVEIGMVIWGRSFLARSSGLTYRLPHICALAVGATLARRVEQMIALSASVASKPPAEAQPATTPQPSPAGDASTDATATG